MNNLQTGMHVIATDMEGNDTKCVRIDYVVKEQPGKIIIASGGRHLLFFSRIRDLFSEKYGSHPQYTSILLGLVENGYFTPEILADYRLNHSIPALDDALAIHAANLLTGQ